MLFAAAMRVMVEAFTLPLVFTTPRRAAAARLLLAWITRLAYFVGVPAWLVLRLLSN
jgi:apolipoprotein N-acyltransferase